MDNSILWITPPHILKNLRLYIYNTNFQKIKPVDKLWITFINYKISKILHITATIEKVISLCFRVLKYFENSVNSKKNDGIGHCGIL